MSAFIQPINLRAMGFCGIDDSCSPELLQLLSAHYTWIEWGVLFRPDLAGTSRYASDSWLKSLIEVNNKKGQIMRLAAHLCSSRCQEVIEGKIDFLTELKAMGFGRVQINATAANNVFVDATKIPFYAQNIVKCMESFPELEFIIQCNPETEPIWGILVQSPPKNMSILFDASCGKGIFSPVFQKPLPGIPCGYAGGMGPSNITSVLSGVREASNGERVWIDMESSLRMIVVTKQQQQQQEQQQQQQTQAGNVEEDMFSIEKCFQCIQAGVLAGLPSSRFTLLSI